MNDATIEQRIYEEESSALDFKRDQYVLQSATDEQMGELIKDILAFANAWRRTTAYILYGVKEVRGGRSNPVAVVHHLNLNDSDVQQLVNSRTIRPVRFAERLESSRFAMSVRRLDGAQLTRNAR